jgi:hypothetical protein
MSAVLGIRLWLCKKMFVVIRDKANRVRGYEHRGGKMFNGSA